MRGRLTLTDSRDKLLRRAQVEVLGRIEEATVSSTMKQIEHEKRVRLMDFESEGSEQ